ncbi:ABC transporter ATP-binding protein [Actinophytocola sp.]|jgi:branched-chain amino acid transport system ATP-binding protein|uniref:ABC transporter ATP-binding protein n=1 Tax=Actinophytocola sp. TaxID=1872138 RepID=UPI002EDAD3DD
MSTPLLQVTGITAGYGRGSVLRDLTIEVPERSVVAVIGPNGTGKTTLLRCVSGVVRPTAGTVALAGEHIHRLRPNAIVARGIAHVPQGRQLFGTLTVAENLRLGGHAARHRDDLDRRMAELCETFPIVAERRDALAGTLSGGQQQMVAIARGLMSDPRLLLLDEPSVGLAPTVIDDVAKLVAGLRESGRTVLLSEQNVPLALALADHVYVIAQGSVIAHGAPGEIGDMAEIRRAFLGMAAPEGSPA